jgi:hypothetical protein
MYASVLPFSPQRATGALKPRFPRRGLRLYAHLPPAAQRR